VKEHKLAVIRLFGAKGLQDDFPPLWEVWVDARFGIGGRKGLEKIPIEKIDLDRTIDSRVPKHSAQTTVDEAVNAPSLQTLGFQLVLQGL
jgi:hypothetical protein